MSGRELYGIPETQVGAAAAVDLAPGQVASAWADYPDCGALAGVTLAPEQELRERVSLAGVSAISGGLPEPTAWPTSRCVASVAAIAAGSYRMAPGLTGIVHANR